MDNEWITTEENDSPDAAGIDTTIPAGAMADPKIPPFKGD
jgi:hypothetical protein